jgi:hypothetical protein
MMAHPGIVFKDGPSGRRAALAFGPDVWEDVIDAEIAQADEESWAGEAAWQAGRRLWA